MKGWFEGEPRRIPCFLRAKIRLQKSTSILLVLGTNVSLGICVTPGGVGWSVSNVKPLLLSRGSETRRTPLHPLAKTGKGLLTHISQVTWTFVEENTGHERIVSGNLNPVSEYHPLTYPGNTPPPHV